MALPLDFDLHQIKPQPGRLEFITRQSGGRAATAKAATETDS